MPRAVAQKINRAFVKILNAAIQLYQIGISPWLGQYCRYTPTCSEYARLAINQYGAARGLLLALKRLLRCHPFSCGGWDPVRRGD